MPPIVYPGLPAFRKKIAFWKVLRSRSFVLLVRARPRWRRVWSTAAMTDGEKQNCLYRACPTSTVFTTNITWTDMGSNPGLRGGRPATDHLSHGMAVTRPRRTAAQHGASIPNCSTARRVYTELQHSTARLYRTHRYNLLGTRGLTERPGQRWGAAGGECLCVAERRSASQEAR